MINNGTEVSPTGCALHPPAERVPHLQQRAALGDHGGRLLVPGTGDWREGDMPTASIIWLVSTVSIDD